uniref:Chitin-binding type-2 domain-containing protein n=1 Tax=Anopheles maculatus TaxID=74869 RepID=A0A182TB50_9DIPT
MAARCIRDNSNGEPGCKTKEEIEQGVWRHNYDPTRYWECTKLNERAILRSCQDQAFHPTQLDCVDWDDWEWEPQDDQFRVATHACFENWNSVPGAHGFSSIIQYPVGAGRHRTN